MENGVAVWRPRAQASGQPSARGATGTRGVTSRRRGPPSPNSTRAAIDLATLNTDPQHRRRDGGDRGGGRDAQVGHRLTGWGTDAKKKQALIDRVKQVIGKTLEGGVLRKEDEVKYETHPAHDRRRAGDRDQQTPGIDTAIASSGSDAARGARRCRL